MIRNLVGALRQRQRTENSRMGTQPWRDDIVVDALQQLRRTHVVVQQLEDAPRIAGKSWPFDITPPPMTMRSGETVQMKFTSARAR